MTPDISDTTPSVRLTESTRVEAFSDAVMAIIITILVLESRVPQHEPARLRAALETMWGSLLAFLRISVLWLNHHALFVRVRDGLRHVHRNETLGSPLLQCLRWCS